MKQRQHISERVNQPDTFCSNKHCLVLTKAKIDHFNVSINVNVIMHGIIFGKQHNKYIKIIMNFCKDKNALSTAMHVIFKVKLNERSRN